MIFNVDDRAVTKSRLEFQQYLMKAYVPHDETGHEIMNDPLKGYVSKKFDPKLHQEI